MIIENWCNIKCDTVYDTCWYTKYDTVVYHEVRFPFFKCAYACILYKFLDIYTRLFKFSQRL